MNTKLLFFLVLLTGTIYASFCLGSEQTAGEGAENVEASDAVQAERKSPTPLLPPESGRKKLTQKQLTPFVPSEEIPGGQAVDFPADI